MRGVWTPIRLSKSAQAHDYLQLVSNMRRRVQAVAVADVVEYEEEFTLRLLSPSTV